jgi:hypothetical protein
MTPQEKAKELLLKFMAIQFGDFPTTDAKRCALIAVDEMIELCESYVTPYYQQVKQEIENYDQLHH